MSVRLPWASPETQAPVGIPIASDSSSSRDIPLQDPLRTSYSSSQDSKHAAASNSSQDRIDRYRSATTIGTQYRSALREFACLSRPAHIQSPSFNSSSARTTRSLHPSTSNCTHSPRSLGGCRGLPLQEIPACWCQCMLLVKPPVQLTRHTHRPPRHERRLNS